MNESVRTIVKFQAPSDNESKAGIQQLRFKQGPSKPNDCLYKVLGMSALGFLSVMSKNNAGQIRCE